MFKKNNLDAITLENIKEKMFLIGFCQNFIDEIIRVLEIRIKRDGISEFQKWFKHLHYRLPEEFKDDLLIKRLYENYSNWIELEVEKLEKETKLSWEKQTEDLRDVNKKVRKTQLVIRHRLSDIALDLITNVVC